MQLFNCFSFPIGSGPCCPLSAPHLYIKRTKTQEKSLTRDHPAEVAELESEHQTLAASFSWCWELNPGSSRKHGLYPWTLASLGLFEPFSFSQESVLEDIP